MSNFWGAVHLFYPFYKYILIFIEIGGIKNSFQTSKYKKREVRSFPSLLHDNGSVY